jgi:hypothetical protein
VNQAFGVGLELVGAEKSQFKANEPHEIASSSNIPATSGKRNIMMNQEANQNIEIYKPQWNLNKNSSFDLIFENSWPIPKRINDIPHGRFFMKNFMKKI